MTEVNSSTTYIRKTPPIKMPILTEFQKVIPKCTQLMSIQGFNKFEAILKRPLLNIFFLFALHRLIFWWCKNFAIVSHCFFNFWDSFYAIFFQLQLFHLKGPSFALNAILPKDNDSFAPTDLYGIADSSTSPMEQLKPWITEVLGMDNVHLDPRSQCGNRFQWEY